MNSIGHSYVSNVNTVSSIKHRIAICMTAMTGHLDSEGEVIHEERSSVRNSWMSNPLSQMQRRTEEQLDPSYGLPPLALVLFIFTNICPEQVIGIVFQRVSPS